MLSGTAVCGRCGTRLYGTRGGNGNRYARYLCAKRTRQHACDQPQALASRIETQLTDFVGSFRLADDQVQAVLAKIKQRSGATDHPKVSIGALRGRLERVRDLYELGDLGREEFQRRKTKVVALLADAEPLPDVDLERCVALLHNFSDLWEGESDPKQRQAFVRLVFERIAVEGGTITAVEPRSELLPLFTERKGVQSGSDGAWYHAAHPEVAIVRSVTLCPGLRGQAAS